MQEHQLIQKQLIKSESIFHGPMINCCLMRAMCPSLYAVPLCDPAQAHSRPVIHSRLIISRIALCLRP